MDCTHIWAPRIPVLINVAKESVRPGFWCHERHSCIWESFVRLFFHLVKLIRIFNVEKPESWLGGEEKWFLGSDASRPTRNQWLQESLLWETLCLSVCCQHQQAPPWIRRKTLQVGTFEGCLDASFGIVLLSLLPLPRCGWTAAFPPVGCGQLPMAASLRAQKTLSRVRKVEVSFFFSPHSVCHCIVQLCYLNVGQSKKRSPYSPGRKWQAYLFVLKSSMYGRKMCRTGCWNLIVVICCVCFSVLVKLEL